MKKKYLKSITAHVIMVMLSLLCLTGHQTAGAQNRNMGEEYSQEVAPLQTPTLLKK